MRKSILFFILSIFIGYANSSYSQSIISVNGENVKIYDAYNSVFLKRNSKVLFQVDTVFINNILVVLNFVKECTVMPETDWIMLNDSLGVILNFAEGLEYGEKTSLFKTSLYKKTENIWLPVFSIGWLEMKLFNKDYVPLKFVANNVGNNRVPMKFFGKVFPMVTH